MPAPLRQALKPRGRGRRSAPEILQKKTVYAGAETRRLVYTPWFKEFVSRNKGMIGAFLNARKAGLGIGQAMKATGGTRIKLVGEADNGRFVTKYWKVSIGKKSFFVKEESTLATRFHHGPNQVDALRRLESVLPRYGENLEVVNYHLGWKSNASSFLVTDFYDLRKLFDRRTPEWARREFAAFQGAIEREDPHMRDLMESHAFYDGRRKKIIIFDVFVTL